MNAAHIENRVRLRMDDWRLWVIVSYLGLTFVVIALWWVNFSSNKADQDLIAANKALIQSNCAEIEEIKREFREFIVGLPIDLGDTFMEKPCPRHK